MTFDVTQGHLSPFFSPSDVPVVAALQLPGGLDGDHLRHEPKFPVRLGSFLQGAGAAGRLEKGRSELALRQRKLLITAELFGVMLEIKQCSSSQSNVL